MLQVLLPATSSADQLSWSQADLLALQSYSKTGQHEQICIFEPSSLQVFLQFQLSHLGSTVLCRFCSRPGTADIIAQLPCKGGSPLGLHEPYTAHYKMCITLPKICEVAAAGRTRAACTSGVQAARILRSGLATCNFDKASQSPATFDILYRA